MSKHKIKLEKIRNWLSVAAKFRNSSGAMGVSKKEANRMACRNWKYDCYEGYSNKKNFNVIAYQTKKFVISVLACNEKHAINEAESIPQTNDEWKEDYNYCDFSISHVEE